MDTAPFTELPELFEHTKRSDWGLAILTWEGRDKRCYQFQDGRLRTFKKGFYGFLKAVDRPVDEVREIVDQLAQRHAVVTARQEVMAEAKKAGSKLMTFEDQVRVFKHLYPGGFSDPAYLDKVRGTEETRRKKHREPAIADARKRLSRERLSELIEARDFAAVHAEALAAVNGTDIASQKTDRVALQKLEASAHEDFANALFEMLYGEGPVAQRFDRYVKVLGEGSQTRVTWPLATAVQALVFPTDRVAVKPSVFRQQAKWMAPRLMFDNDPVGHQYEQLESMAFSIRRRLEQADIPPSDLMDVYDFIWITLRPKAKEILDSFYALDSPSEEE